MPNRWNERNQNNIAPVSSGRCLLDGWANSESIFVSNSMLGSSSPWKIPFNVARQSGSENCCCSLDRIKAISDRRPLTESCLRVRRNHASRNGLETESNPIGKSLFLSTPRSTHMIKFDAKHVAFALQPSTLLLISKALNRSPRRFVLKTSHNYNYEIDQNRYRRSYGSLLCSFLLPRNYRSSFHLQSTCQVIDSCRAPFIIPWRVGLIS